MKTLYVTDLDGTLLNMEQKLNEETRVGLNELIDRGVNITVSTGRGDSCINILNRVHFKYPIMILNGALNYDFDRKEYVNRMPILRDTVLDIIKKLENFKCKTFKIKTIVNSEFKQFSILNWDKKTECLALNILHDTKNSSELANILREIKGINFFIHKNVYSEGESFCDIVLENVSKASKLKLFKEQYKFDKVIAFGDSENDLPLAEVADEFYAVENATDIVKQKATGIIESCFENGVVKFIANQTQNDTKI